MAKLKRRERKRPYRLTPERAQIIAVVIVRGDTPIKNIALDFGCSYGTVWKVLQDYVIVEKKLRLRYPEGPPTEPVQKSWNGELPLYLSYKITHQWPS